MALGHPMRNSLLTIFAILLWNAPACYLAYLMGGGAPSGSVGRDFGSVFASMESTERFFLDWLAINCLVALIGLAVLCASSRLRYLVRGEEKQFNGESIATSFGCLVLGLISLLAYRSLFD